MRSLRAGVVLVLAAIVGCGDTRPALVGVLYPNGHQGLQLARVVGIVGDSGSATLRPQFPLLRIGEESEVVLAAVESFSADRRLVAVVGPAGSRGALAAAALLNARGIPHIVPNATSDRLVEAGSWTFSLAPSNSAQGQLLADFAVDSLHAHRIAIVHVSDEYGLGLREGVASRLGARGVGFADEVVVQAAAQLCATTHVRESMDLVARALVARTHPDVVILGVGVTVGRCLAESLLTADPGVRVVAGDGLELTDRDVVRLPEASRERLFTVVMWEPGTDAANRAFREAARTVSSREPTPSEALVFDAFGLLAAAVNEVGPSRAAVRDWLQSLGRARPPWHGVTGPVSFVPGARNAILRVRAVHTHD